MDSRLKRTVIVLMAFSCILILAIVGAANFKTIKKRIEKRNAPVVASVEKEEETALPVTDPKQIGDNLYAWKNDASFFDDAGNSLAAKIMEEMKTLTLRAVSVQKDLRISVIDYAGNVKEGEEFWVEVAKSKKTPEIYKDTDRDGVIYIDSLSSGDYTVSLQKKDGYIVPEAPIAVSVKDSVEYAKIEDIGLLLTYQTEAEANIDDMMMVSAKDSAPKKEKKGLLDYTNAKYGVDVSSHNGEIDWEKVYASGVRFVMLRCGYRGGITGDIVVDEFFKENATKAIRAGLDVGAYFFTQAVDEKEAVEEASAVLEILDGVSITYPVAIRVDRAGGLSRADGIDSDTRTQVTEAFCSTIANYGYTPCVYASSDWLKTNLSSRRMEKYTIWMAEYASQTPTKDYWYDLWQYSSVGEIDGIEGEVSLNLSYLE